MTSKLQEAIKIVEAAKKDGIGGHILKVVLITEGLGNRRNMNYYGPEAIASAPLAFEGKSCFIDHASESEERDIPERRIKTKCGYYKNLSTTMVDGKRACVGELHLDVSESGKWAYAKALTALHYRKEFPGSTEEYVGLSVNADGDAERRTMTVEGETLDVNYITKFTEGDSCDMVTRPARGGRIVAVVEDKNGATKNSKEAQMKLSKKLESALTALKEAAAEKDTELKNKKIAEAQKMVEAEDESEAESEAEDMLAKREDESEADYKNRLGGLAKALKKRMGASEDDAADEDSEKGKDSDSEDETEGESEDAAESSRLAVKHLIQESKIPASIYSAADIARLAKMSLREAKADIEKTARLHEAIKKEVVSEISDISGTFVAKGREADGGKFGNAAFESCMKI